MSNLSAVLSEIVGCLTSEPKSSPVDKGPWRSVVEFVASRLPLTELKDKLGAAIGKQHVENFLGEVYPRDSPPANFHLVKILLDIVTPCISIAPDGTVTVNEGEIKERLTRLDECIRTGELTYRYTLRLANVDITDPFQLTDSIRFQKATPAEVAARYPLNRDLFGVAQQAEKNWLRHCVEVVITRQGNAKAFREDTGIEGHEAIVNSVIHSFMLAKTSVGVPHATHVLASSPIESVCHLRNMNVGWSAPKVMTEADIEALRKAFDFLQQAESDHVLETAVDRLLLAMKRGDHHPNHVNAPNWDKLVDYVIALETLLLTTNGSSADQELSYRFRLNGSTLLSECTDKRSPDIFHALRHLYSLRSKIVHGCSETVVAKPAMQFAKALSLEIAADASSLAKFNAVAMTVQEWIRKLLFHLASMPPDERPYCKQDGWESRLWNPTTA